MTPSALEWFVHLCTHYLSAPIEAQKLGQDIAKQLKRKNDRVQFNRAFKRHSTSLPTIHTWLTGLEMSTAIRSKRCRSTLSAHVTTVAAIKKIIAGEVPSTVWSMGKQRGIDVSLSTTLDAVALVGYLMKITGDDWLPENLFPASEELSEENLFVAFVYNQRTYKSGKLFTQAAALHVASTLFRVNEDNVRRYTGVDPTCDKSEALFAYVALIKHGLLSKADSYFDVEDLLKAATRPDLETNVTI